MNGRHFRTFLWLRWRLLVNQVRRTGTANMVAAILVGICGVVAAAIAAVSLFALGWSAGGGMSPAAVLYTWDGVAGAFLFFWLIGLMVELQRAEALSLNKILHLPVSLRTAFVVNYLSSLVNPCMVIFLPGMLGLTLGLTLARGPLMLLAFPLLAAFLLTVTALTYQFQGWLAALMSNPRRRRTVVVFATMIVIVIAQLPNLLNMMRMGGGSERDETNARIGQWNELSREMAEKSISPEEFERRKAELERQKNAAMERKRLEWEETEKTVRIVNAVVPPGWLPFGAMALAEGNIVPALLGTAGLGLIGGVSLWRAYRTTLKLYTGATSVGRASSPSEQPTGWKPVPLKEPQPRPATSSFLERRLPGLSEQTAAIALAGFRGLTRAPEAKMMLLSPIIMLFVFGSMFLTRKVGPPDAIRPLVAAGAIAMILLSMGQMIGNQFGFDRSGFRVFVLCSARRRDILLGKNLSFAPLPLGMAAIILVLLQFVFPMRIDQFLATVPQAVTMFLLYCLVANMLSMLAPMPIAAGSMRPTNNRLVPVLLHLSVVVLLPVILGPALLPIGVEALMDWTGARSGVPVALILSVAICAATVFVYRLAVNWQGRLLQAREKKILEVVASKAE